MDIETSHGLTTAVASATEAVETDWENRRLRDQVDVVRVVDPEPEFWPRLRQAEFIIMPGCVTWVAPLGESEDAFVDRLSFNERRNIHRTQRFAATHGIELTVTAPISAPAFDAFLDLYERQVGAMRHGVPFARQQRADILDHNADYYAVQAFDKTTLLGSCVCLKRATTMYVRFTTTTPDGRNSRVVRAMYMRAFQVARDIGCDTVSLGTDPTLYGHIAKPGLFRFKSRLGFTPIPARILGTFDDPDEATRVLTLGTLSEPSLALAYDLPQDAGPEWITTETALQLEILTAEKNINIDDYRAPFLTEIRIREIR